MVSLMDRLLKLENLDLHLTPYRVLATGQDEGMMEFIPSRSLAQVLNLTLLLPLQPNCGAGQYDYTLYLCICCVFPAFHEVQRSLLFLES